MQIKQILRYQLVYILLAVLLVVAVILNINTGNIHISPARIFRIIFLKGDMGTPEYNIIWKIRLPRLCMAAILGGALSLSGFLLQTFFRNPIAGPFVLGISSGAKMFVAITMIFLLKYVSGMPLWAQVAAAFVGSLLAMLYVLIFANKVKSMSMLLVVGIMISYICSAITDLCITFANDSDIANLTHWAMGSFSGSSWPTVKLAAVVVFPTAVITFLFSKPGIEEGRKPGIARHILRDAVDDLHHAARLALRLPAIGVDHSGSVRRKFKFQHRNPPKSDLLDTSSCMIGAC